MSVRKIYETTFIINAALEDFDVESIITKVTNYIESLGADILQINKWGRRRLAYPINKKYNGYYVHILYEASPSIIPIFERFLILDDTILRHLTLALPKRLRNYRLRSLAEGKSPIFAMEEPPKAEPVTLKETVEAPLESETVDNSTVEIAESSNDKVETE
ncbi:MAG: 30S ribosomal protein S6 [Ignavibacteria bacterium]|nr:30S ribosomal protein S6 [Ignavibacteria bacterium]